jgi:hypothetical protein
MSSSSTARCQRDDYDDAARDEDVLVTSREIGGTSREIAFLVVISRYSQP